MQIVTNGGPAGKPTTLLAWRETMRISGGEADSASDLLYGINAVAVGDSGNVYVSDGALTIRVYDANGKLLRKFGRRGDGPGEFRSIIGMLVHHDTVAVSDLRSRRLTRFDEHGGIVDEQSILEGPSLFIIPVALFDNGWLVSLRHRAATAQEGLRRDTLPIRRVSTMAEAFAMAAVWDTAQTPTPPINVLSTWRFFSPPGYWSWGPLWAAEAAHVPDGSGNLYVTDGLHYDVSTYSPDGKLIRKLSRSHKPLPITQKLIDDYFALVEKAEREPVRDSAGRIIGRPRGGGGGEVAANSELSRKSIPHGDTLPALGRMLVSSEGAIWVERPDLVDDPIALEWTKAPRTHSYWDVFDEAGRFRGTVKFPPTFTPRAAMRNAIVGVTRDTDDVESIVVYTISF